MTCGLRPPGVNLLAIDLLAKSLLRTDSHRAVIVMASTLQRGPARLAPRETEPHAGGGFSAQNPFKRNPGPAVLTFCDAWARTGGI